MRDHKGLNEIASIIRREIVTYDTWRRNLDIQEDLLSAVEILTALLF